MVIPQKIIKFLEKARVKYEPIEHKTVYTAHDKAVTLKVPEKIIGKTLILKTDNKLSFVLISANKNLDIQKFLKVVNRWLKKKCVENSHGRIRSMRIARLRPSDFGNANGHIRMRYSHADFATERLIKNKIKGVKVGVIPPFGNLWGLPTFVDKTLLKEPKIIVNAGDYNWSIKIAPAVLKKLISNRRVSATPPFKKGWGNIAKRAEISLLGIPDLIIGNFSATKKKK